jgi:hypothetical protein
MHDCSRLIQNIYIIKMLKNNIKVKIILEDLLIDTNITTLLNY